MTKQDRIDMEHEAEAYAEKYKTASPQEQSLIALAYLDGIKLGLKQHAHDYLIKTIELKRKHEEHNKANEWHYMKDVNCYEDLHFPPEEEEKGRVLIWKVQVITEKRIKERVCYHCGSYGDLWYEINAYHVIAWKEIVLPKELSE